MKECGIVLVERRAACVCSAKVATLFIVSTPIGNLEDITLRAVRTLREVSLIACEDTRHTRKLLDHLGIATPATSYHEHNEAAKTEELIDKLRSGLDIALVSDAGTPLISDPGYRVVSAAAAAGIAVVPIPGPSAILGALAAAGLPTDSFRFGGFLPPKTTQRRRMLEELRTESATLVFYEAPHRILDALEDVEAVLGPRPVVVARELTKLHEEFLRGTGAEVRAQLAARPSIKGEMTLLIGKAKEGSIPSEQTLEDAVRELEDQGLSRMDAIKQVAKARGIGKREVYSLLTRTPP
jgi:16S rRNA (cytidine1402-2'-O)-methyltransferase